MLGRLILFIAIILIGAGLVMPVNCAPDECTILDHGLFNPDRFEADTNVGIVGNLYGLLLLATLIPGVVALINFDRLSVTGSALVVTLTAAVIFSRFYMLDDQNLGWGWGLIGAGCLFWLASSLLTPSPAMAAIPIDASHTLPAAGFPQAGARPMGPAGAGGMHHTIIAGEEPMRPQAGFHTVIEENFNAAAAPPRPTAQPYGQPPYGQSAMPPNPDPFGATRIDGPIMGGPAGYAPPVDPMGATMLDNSANLNATQAGQHRAAAPPPVDPNEATRIDAQSHQTPPPSYPQAPQRPVVPPAPVDDQALYKTVIDGGQGQAPPPPPPAPPSFQQPTPPSVPTPPRLERPAPPPADIERTNIVPAAPDPMLPPTEKTSPQGELPPTDKTPTPPNSALDATAFHQVVNVHTPPASAPQAEPTPPPPSPPASSPSPMADSQAGASTPKGEADKAAEAAPSDASYDMNPIEATLVIPPSKDSQATPPPIARRENPPIDRMESTGFHQVAESPAPEPRQPDMSVSQIMSNFVADFDLDDDEDEAAAPPNIDPLKTLRPDAVAMTGGHDSTPVGQSTPQLDEPPTPPMNQESEPPSEEIEQQMVAEMTGEVPSEGVVGEGEIPSEEVDFMSDEVVPEPPPAADNFKTQIDVDTGASDDDDAAALWKTQIDNS